MFYLLISLTPVNCMQTCNILLYAATVFYWVITLVPRALIAENNTPFLDE
jgi:hypothetical protein